MGKTLTIFDLDNTLIKGDSSTLWSRFMVREGWVNDPDYLAREARLMEDYDRGEMNIADYVALIQAPLIGVAKRDVDAQMLVISASVSLLVQAVAAELGIEQALGIDVVMADGGYSGVIAGTPSYQQGKVVRLELWLAAHPDYSGEITFYTDSINDLPLCLRADRVRLVNPCPQLAAANAQHRWAVLAWRL